MSFRKGFDTGYNLAVRHVIERAEEVIGEGKSGFQITDDLRDFYKGELKSEDENRAQLVNDAEISF